ncbi:hypothetical protein BC939DRAFT_480583 [Gamsiella multidivaricata]|uniref:uncharacterized protein n=1 Tax=Gamsiella multidivaricata TaxID=101098 RepID=UPI002220AF49|nr:uncharacterized protein BC939DRAFT_480583 [Gamsiella multidivaricata]KAG0367035.1 hypothetical protein BGZ54_004521 [Gamsiella multidivaricata]KAI7818142.1 hypothetical protein BC939DRAFT_480583 [Gamsiella multidivaricata]
MNTNTNSAATATKTPRRRSTLTVLLIPLAIAFLLVLALVCPQVAAAPIDSTADSGAENVGCLKSDVLSCSRVIRRFIKDPKPSLDLIIITGESLKEHQPIEPIDEPTDRSTK